MRQLRADTLKLGCLREIVSRRIARMLLPTPKYRMEPVSILNRPRRRSATGTFLAAADIIDSNTGVRAMPDTIDRTDANRDAAAFMGGTLAGTFGIGRHGRRKYWINFATHGDGASQVDWRLRSI